MSRFFRKKNRDAVTDDGASDVSSLAPPPPPAASSSSSSRPGSLRSLSPFSGGGRAGTSSTNKPAPNGDSSSSSLHPASASASVPGSSAASTRSGTVRSTSTSASASAPTSHLILRPHPSVTVPPVEPPSGEEQAKLLRLRKHMREAILRHYYVVEGEGEGEGKQSTASARTPRPDGSKDEQGVLVERWYEKWEWRWLDFEEGDATFRRYLRAAKGSEDEAVKRLEGTLAWRRSFKPDIIVPSEVKIEGETGKHLLSGFDNEGRSILYLTPSRENTKPSDRQIKYLVWGLERAIDVLPPGQGKLTLVIDFKNASQSQNPSVSTALKVISILQNHYVERLGRGVMMNPPWYLNAFWATISPFLDPVTKSKVIWNPPLRDFIHPSQLPRYYGGEWDFVFDKDVFWDDVLDFTGIASDGTRAHESFAKVSSDEEARIREGMTRGGGGGGGGGGGEQTNSPPTPATAIVGAGAGAEVSAEADKAEGAQVRATESAGTSAAVAPEEDEAASVDADGDGDGDADGDDFVDARESLTLSRTRTGGAAAAAAAANANANAAGRVAA